MSGELVFAHVGFGAAAVPYLAGWELQRAVHERRANGEIVDDRLHAKIFGAPQGMASRSPVRV